MKSVLMQMSRVSSGADVPDEIQVEIVNTGPKGERVHIRLGVPMDKFASMLMGEAHVPCEVRRWFIEGAEK